MRIVGVSLTDGRVSLITRYSDGLHLSVIGLDPRGDASLGSGSPTVVGPLASLVVVPSPISLTTGEATFEFTALGYDADGNEVTITPVWSIVEGSPYASIDADTGALTTGILTEEEDVTVRAAVGSLTADAAVSIADIVLDSLVIAPDAWEMAVGTTRQFTAVGYVGDVVVSVSPVWSLVSGVGSINASTGLYTAGTTPGSAVIRATVGAETLDANITVAAGAAAALSISPEDPSILSEGSQVFTVSALDSYGNTVEIDGTPEWYVEDGGTLLSSGAAATLTVESSTLDVNYANPALSVTYRSLYASTGFTITGVP
ncbi:putative T1Ss secreted agglutinin rtX [Caudoviricetes sp.]|nr:putative T1Ss secreted agglutinin rtX [Caudoviricetes sp.]